MPKAAVSYEYSIKPKYYRGDNSTAKAQNSVDVVSYTANMNK